MLVVLLLSSMRSLAFVPGRFFSTHRHRKALFFFCFAVAVFVFEEINFAVFRSAYKNFYVSTEFHRIRSVRAKENISIGVLTVVKDANIADYSLAMNSVKCYSIHHGYSNLFEDIADDEALLARCNHSDFMFQRHCVTARIAERHPELNWILFIDADMGVINPNHLIEEYIPDSAEIIFYERIFNHEIMAGSYLFKNSKYARDFLDFWADYQFRLPNSVHGTDNGAIHNVFIDQLRPDLNKQVCQRIWNNSKNYDDLWNYVTCTRWLIGEQSEFDSGRVLLIKKGRNAWCRDGWLTNSLWSRQDFMLHGWQLRKRDSTGFASWPIPFASGHRFDESLCASSEAHLNWPYKNSFVRPDEEIDRWISATIKEVHRDYLYRLQQVFNV
ncbi:hypothetical protein L596_008312 [Steinernema carpocapsae]|uniref:Nucleotide-diphospho-sugar transferase domain-containing protein n=1 Tax=Steinernema carpocapsae TaxID=34508 RepID=A0A4U5PCL9_STECR|nr:hypothetical protein L596_008312 [Steinernema carpocapsae]